MLLDHPEFQGLVERVASNWNFSPPRVIAEYGRWRGTFARDCAAHVSGFTSLFELDQRFARDLERHLPGAACASDPGDAALIHELKRRDIAAALHSFGYSGSAF